MKTSILIAGVGLLALQSGAAFAQSAPPTAGPLGPDAGAAAASGREQQQSFTHVLNSMDREKAQKTTTKKAVADVTAADLVAGAAIRDIEGRPVGKVASVDPEGVVIDTGQTKVRVPVSAFGKDKNGLMIGTTAQKFAELVAKAHAQDAAAAAAAAQAQPRPATAAEVIAGSSLQDIDGKAVGKITKVAADGATVDTGKTIVKLPIDAFGVDPQKGLILAITLEDLEQLIAQSRGSKAAK